MQLKWNYSTSSTSYGNTWVFHKELSTGSDVQHEYTIINSMILTLGRSSHHVCIKSVKSKFIKKTFRSHIKVYSAKYNTEFLKQFSKNSPTETVPEQRP